MGIDTRKPTDKKATKKKGELNSQQLGGDLIFQCQLLQEPSKKVKP